MKKLMFKEKRAKELLLKMLEDLNRRFNLELYIYQNRWHNKNYMWIANKNYFENSIRKTDINLLGIRDKKPTYAKLFNKLVRQPINSPAFQRKIVIDIEKMYGSSYEEIMMNLDLNGVE